MLTFRKDRCNVLTQSVFLRNFLLTVSSDKMTVVTDLVARTTHPPLLNTNPAKQTIINTDKCRPGPNFCRRWTGLGGLRPSNREWGLSDPVEIMKLPHSQPTTTFNHAILGRTSERESLITGKIAARLRQ